MPCVFFFVAGGGGRGKRKYVGSLVLDASHQFTYIVSRFGSCEVFLQRLFGFQTKPKLPIYSTAVLGCATYC